jgi:hypothetical protein
MGLQPVAAEGSFLEDSSGLTQAELATRTGMHRYALLRVERGNVRTLTLGLRGPYYLFCRPLNKVTGVVA